ncbi:MAG: septal ring lytic transglycosylase RlpA family protein [Hyphomicrobiaceae bacterium]
MKRSKLRSVAAMMAGVFVPVSSAGMGSVSAKEPGQVHCYKNICHRVLSLDETADAVGAVATVVASYYGAPGEDRFNPSLVTSSGEIFDPERSDNAASPVLPDGTIVLVRYPATGKAAVVRINNAGPYWSNRTLDVSKATAEGLGFAGVGVAELQLTVLAAPSGDDAQYRRGRRYQRVAGFIGAFASIETAAAAVDDITDAMSTETLAAAGHAEPAVRFARPRAALVQAAGPRTKSVTIADEKRRERPQIATGTACGINGWPNCGHGLD